MPTTQCGNKEQLREHLACRGSDALPYLTRAVFPRKCDGADLSRAASEGHVAVFNDWSSQSLLLPWQGNNVVKAKESIRGICGRI